jgi:hypothetical protein
MRYFAALALLVPLSALPNPHEQEIQRALIQRDQQSAEFAKGLPEDLRASQLREAARPLHPDPEIARQLRPYQRMKMTEERERSGSDPDFRTAPKSGSDPKPLDLRPLPLPGGPRGAVDPVTAPSLGN